MKLEKIFVKPFVITVISLVFVFLTAINTNAQVMLEKTGVRFPDDTLQTTAATGGSNSGWTDDGATVRLTTNTEQRRHWYVSTASAKLNVLGTTELNGDVDINSDLDVDAGTLHVDGTNNRVGVKNQSPATTLHLRHTIGTLQNGLTIQHDFGGSWNIYTASNTSNNELWLIFNGVLKGEFNPTTGAYSAVSDKRLKKNIEPIGKVLGMVMDLKPSKYHFKENKDSDPKYFGLIGQELRNIFPEVVTINPNGKEGGGIEGMHTVSYMALIPILIKGIQEQQEIIEGQQSSIEKLKGEVENVVLKQKLNTEKLALEIEIKNIKSENESFRSENKELRDNLLAMGERLDTLENMFLAGNTIENKKLACPKDTSQNTVGLVVRRAKLDSTEKTLH